MSPTRIPQNLRPGFFLTAVTVVAAALTGCQTYTAQTTAQDTAVRSGSIAAAVDMANKRADAEKNSADAVIARLEQGAILRQAALAEIPLPVVAEPVKPAAALGTATTATQTETNVAAPAAPAPTPDRAYLRQSIAAFNLAEEKVNDYDEQAQIRLGREAGALFTNQQNLPYRGRAYDKVMMNAYKALNYIQLGDKDAARVELNRALQRQRDAVAENAKRIEQAQQAAQEAAPEAKVGEGGPTDIEKVRADPKSGPAFAEVETELNTQIKPYGDYVNPFVVFLDGLFFLSNAENNADLERARKSLERVAGFAPDNPYAKADFAAAEAAATGNLPSGLTYIIFETGAAPFREQLRIDIPVFLITGKLSYAGAAFPKLKFQNDFIPELKVTAGTETWSSSVICTMDSVVAQDFKNDWWPMATKTIIATSLKAAMDAVIQKQASDRLGYMGQLAAKAVTAAAGASMNIADTRTWRSLPKQFQYVRVATPPDRKLALDAGGQTRNIELSAGRVNVVYVKSTNATSPLLVDQFVLKP